MAQRRWLHWPSSGIRVAILYYKDAGDSRSVWLQDNDGDPVQIALWPKRIPLGFSGGASSASSTGDLVRNTVGSWHTILSNDTTLDSEVFTRRHLLISGTVSSSLASEGFPGSFEARGVIGEQIAAESASGLQDDSGYKLVEQGSISQALQFSVTGGQTADQTGSENGANVVTGSGTYVDSPNTYGLRYLLKTSSRTIFALLDTPAHGPTRIPRVDGTIPDSDNIGDGPLRTHQRLWYGTASAVQTVERPTLPTADPDDIRFLEVNYRTERDFIRTNIVGDTRYIFDTNPSALIGASTVDISVRKIITGQPLEIIEANIKGIESDTVKVLAVSAVEG